ncbi:MAG: asparagine synthase-related protein [Cyanobacteria bacterium P01_F01_bin.13]
MSAICGIVHLDGQPVAAQALEQMMAALEAYGPDGSHLWQEGSAALGHQMLHTTPESLHESVPWQDGLTELVITADARLDNRDELFTALAIPPTVGRHVSDTQLILRAYIKWGDQSPQHLLGDFAFAIWDGRQQKLFCARDIFGVRPFFYHSSPRCFLFASDLKALLATTEVPHQLNELLLAAFLQQEDITFAQKSLTFYEGIHKLPPAHCLTLTPTQQKIQCYWSTEAIPEIRLESKADYAAMLRDLLDQAVHCRLRSAFPVGAHLSGGLDSSTIAVIAARALRTQGQALRGFSWSPPLTTDITTPEDERRLIEEICHREKIDCHYVALTGQDMINVWSRSFITEPTEMMHFEQKVQAEITNQKTRVVLSGWGGDEAISFNGRGYFAELFLQGHWWTLYQELKHRGELHGLGMRQQVVDKILLPLLPDALVTRWPLMNHIGYQPAGQSAYIHPQLLQKVQSSEETLPQLPVLLRERAGVRTNQRLLLANGHLTNRMESWAISGGQTQSVYSYPLLDRRIVEFALGIPVDMFFQEGWKRYLFRLATADLLPDQVRWNKTKQEVAVDAQLSTSQADIAETWKNIIRTKFQANRQALPLTEWVDMERLERVLFEQDVIQPGFWPALRLLTAFTGTSRGAQKCDRQVIPMV